MLTIGPLGRVVTAQQPMIAGDTIADADGPASKSGRNEGARLFRKETFGGKGPTV
jgi:hypothetical protein